MYRRYVEEALEDTLPSEFEIGNKEGRILRDDHFAESALELLSKVVFELKIKRQSGFQESPRFHQRIVHLQSPLPGNQSHVTFSNSFLHIVPA